MMNYLKDFQSGDHGLMKDDFMCPDDVLDAYIEEEISADEKADIIIMLGRLRRILKWNLSVDENIIDKKRGSGIIRDILAKFDRWKKTFTRNIYSQAADVNTMQYLIVYSLAELCFYYRINDSNMVANVLRSIYAYGCVSTRAFTMYLLSQDALSIGAPQQLHDGVRDENQCLSRMLFFLSHAHRARFLFEDTRFVDLILRVPLGNFLRTTAERMQPSMLLLLLRYGASIEWAKNAPVSSCMMMRDLIRRIYCSMGISHIMSAYSQEMDKVAGNQWILPSNDVKCLRILLRVIRQVAINDLNTYLENFKLVISEVPRNDNSIIDLMQAISEKADMPHLVLRCTKPSDLQHLCRCTIREALNRNWNLPNGIQSLPLPKEMKVYIDLLKD